MGHHFEFAGIHLKFCSEQSEFFSDPGVLSPFCSEEPFCDGYQIHIELLDVLTPPAGRCIYQDGSKSIYQHEGGIVRYAGNENRLHMRIQRQGNSSHVQCLRSEYPAGITPKTLLNAMEAEHLIVSHDGFILHASFVRVGGKAVLFTAPSGSGKSTQANLWCQYLQAELINGDRAAVMVEKDGVFACGIPFSGSSGVAKNARLPLSAIVYLSKSDDNHLQELKGIQAFRKLWEGLSVNVWDREDMDRASARVLDVVSQTPILHLSCRADEDAVLLLDRYLTERGCL